MNYTSVSIKMLECKSWMSLKTLQVVIHLDADGLTPLISYPPKTIQSHILVLEFIFRNIRRT